MDLNYKKTAGLAAFGEEAILSGWLDIGAVGRIPLDRVWARVAVAVTALFVAWLMIGALNHKLSRQR